MTNPNFILILVDQWRGDCLGKLNHPVVETPFLDDLAKDGTIFTSAYSAAPSCIPARACLATGQTPYHCGRIGYEDKVEWNYKDTMMDLFKNNDYQTINVGKTHFYPRRNHLGFEMNILYDPQDFQDGFISDYHRWLDKESNGNVKDPAKIWNNNSWNVLPWQGPTYMHPTEWTTRKAIEVLENRDPTRSFFLQIGYHRPHPPLDPPKFYDDMYHDKVLPEVPVGSWAKRHDKEVHRIDAWEGKLTDEKRDRMRKAYYASITHIDASIGQLLYYLKSKGLYDSTTIVFTSDHGELLGDHHMYRKVNALEGSAKIPFIMKAGNSRDDVQVDYSDIPITHMDIMPTMLEAASIAIPDHVDGQSINKALYGKGNKEGAYVHGEHTGYGKQGWQFITDGKAKYIWETYSGEEWFFDLIHDPHEKVNEIENPDYKEKIEYFRKELIHILANRPEHGLSDGKRLIKGKLLPATIGK